MDSVRVRAGEPRHAVLRVDAAGQAERRHHSPRDRLPTPTQLSRLALRRRLGRGRGSPGRAAPPRCLGPQSVGRGGGVARSARRPDAAACGRARHELAGCRGEAQRAGGRGRSCPSSARRVSRRSASQGVEAKRIAHALFQTTRHQLSACRVEAQGAGGRGRLEVVFRLTQHRAWTCSSPTRSASRRSATCGRPGSARGRLSPLQRSARTRGWWPLRRWGRLHRPSATSH